MISLPDANSMLLGHHEGDTHRRFDALRRLRPGGLPDKPQEDAPGNTLHETQHVQQGSGLREASQDFEAMFLHQLLKGMRATIPHHDPLRGKGEEFWQSHFDMEMATVLARGGGIGLGDLIFEQLRQSQVQAAKESNPPGKPIPLTILSPHRKSSDNEEQVDTPELNSGAALAATYPQVASADGRSFASHQRSPDELLLGDAVNIPGTTSTMSLVRSLARLIEERGGVVPEHPGFLESSAPNQGAVPTSPDLPPMQWPVEGRVSSTFGWRPDPFTGEQSWHAGVDLVAAEGSPIGAAWDGRVVFSGQRGGYGNMVILEHLGGWRSYYAHNHSNIVRVGDQVQAGQQIASVGSSGRSTGPHLHFEVRHGDTAWNPKQIRDRLLAGLDVGKQEPA